MVAGSFYIPKSNKAPLGEDAHFIYIEEEAIGVADGISCWAKKDRRVVIRDGVIVYKSEIQKKGFNYPFQLGNGIKFDDPSVAHEIKVIVRTGDMIVMGTDGLFDNAHDIEFEKLVCDGLVDLHKLGTFRRYVVWSLNPKTEELTRMDWIEPRESPGPRESFLFNEPYTIQIWISQANGRYRDHGLQRAIKEKGGTQRIKDKLISKLILLRVMK
ncbi:hypothetical protein H5410_021287 [Solanum commersonii]|uniref:Protein phosphatase n=1 Tax=Solanum commersonii TaxID=4109 RepID=A0A9J5ZGQ8_SOLCO|nr:hypothetical protein H5410_021287 [Solanum commersonii]